VGGDLITSINGKKIQSMDELDTVLEELEIGQVVTVKVLRNGRKRTLEVKLEEMPP
jgi:S1-C subfamily serine protease